MKKLKELFDEWDKEKGKGYSLRPELRAKLCELEERIEQIEHKIGCVAPDMHPTGGALSAG